MEQPSAKIRRLANGNWDRVFTRLAWSELGQAMDKYPQHVRCPVHGSSGTDDGFRLFDTWRDNGAGICNTCGPKTNGISMLAWVKGLSFADTLSLLFDELDGPGAVVLPAARPNPVTVERDRRVQHAEDQKLANAIRKVWQASLAVDHRRAEPARLYFARRGLTIYNNPQVMRFHPALPYAENGEVLGRYPALVFRVVDAQGRSVTLHRIYLDDGGNKAPVAKPKKLMAYPRGVRTLSGGVIRLAPAGPTLGVAEGPETGLAIMQATGMPVWPAISASLMRKVEVADNDVSRVVAWLDKDANEAGRFAGVALCQRMWAQGVRAGAMVPPLDIDQGATSVDWLNVWNRLGRDGFPSEMVSDSYHFHGKAG